MHKQRQEFTIKIVGNLDKEKEEDVLRVRTYPLDHIHILVIEHKLIFMILIYIFHTYMTVAYNLNGVISMIYYKKTQIQAQMARIDIEADPRRRAMKHAFFNQI